MGIENDTVGEFVILVMGPTGAGKSNFINLLLRANRMGVGHGLVSCTQEVGTAKLHYRQRRLVMVDTPGFDDTYGMEILVLRRISEWFKSSQQPVDGIVYLYDISASRFTETAQRNLLMFQKMCGNAALGTVVLATTHWRTTTREMKLDRAKEKELREVHWKALLDNGARMCILEDTSASAFNVIDVILWMQFSLPPSVQCTPNSATGTPLQIREEMTSNMSCLRTEAGQELRYTQAQLRKLQCASTELNESDIFADATEERRSEIGNLSEQIDCMKKTLTKRMRNMLSRQKLEYGVED